MATTNDRLEEMAAKINAVLAAKGYKTAEARATVWVKETSAGKLERIYLNGRKADGFVHCVGGKWEAEGIRFVNLHHIVVEAIA